jgi:hypothetical protein
MRISFLFLLIISFSVQLKAQKISANDIIHSYDQAYGLSENLYNGKIYFEDKDQPYGSPFLDLPLNLKSIAVINGKSFYDLTILYDCFNQHFVLIFQNKFGGENKIILQKEHIDTISIGNHVFIKNTFDEINNTYVQVIHDGDITCLFSWKKEKVFKTAGENAGYYFTKEKREVFCIKDSVVYRIKSRKHFVDLYPEISGQTIKKKLKLEKINFLKVHPLDLKVFFDSIDQSSAI